MTSCKNLLSVLWSVREDDSICQIFNFFWRHSKYKGKFSKTKQVNSQNSNFSQVELTAFETSETNVLASK